MKTFTAKLILFMAVMMPLVFIGGCDKDDDHHHNNHNHNNNNQGTLDYHATIHSPDSTDKSVNETIQVKVKFEEHNGGKVHHIQVRLFNSDSTALVVFDEPDENHVHVDGEYEFDETFVLSTANGVNANTNWTLEAKVWGHEDEEGEAIESVNFRVQ